MHMLGTTGVQFITTTNLGNGESLLVVFVFIFDLGRWLASFSCCLHELYALQQHLASMSRFASLCISKGVLVKRSNIAADGSSLRKILLNNKVLVAGLVWYCDGLSLSVHNYFSHSGVLIHNDAVLRL